MKIQRKSIIGVSVTTAYVLCGIFIWSLVNDDTQPAVPVPALSRSKSITGTGTPANSPAQIHDEMQQLVSHTRPCVVSVVSYGKLPVATAQPANIQLLNPHQEGDKNVSSGILIGNNGYVLTTQDAVPSHRIEVKLFKRKPNVFPAKIVQIDSGLNLALLQITLRSKERQPTPCTIGDSNTAEVGDIVLAFGSPYGFSQTVTSGIISSQRRKVQIDGKFYKQLLQTDAVINEGNNGGPIINILGEVIGINAAVYSVNKSYTGIGFAIPINVAKTLMKKAL